METYGEYSKIINDNVVQIYSAIMDAIGISNVLKELTTNQALAKHFENIESYEFSHKFKPFQNKNAIINIEKLEKNEKHTFKETDASGCDSDLVTKWVNVDYYTFDLLDEESTILYNLLMRLELEDYDAIEEIFRIYNEKINLIDSLQKQINNYHHQINDNPDSFEETTIYLSKLIEQKNTIKNSDIFRYYKLICSYIRKKIIKVVSAEILEKEIEQAEALIERNEYFLKRNQNKLSLTHNNIKW